jgi:hypothetical protein
MTTSSYAPNLVVEIAFNAGFRTPAADRIWTDVSDYVELAADVTINGGRGDERSTADANQLSLTLDNSDGRFTPFRAASPYYPYVKLDRPIRVRATPVDGPERERFLGYVNNWPIGWDGTDAYSRAAISASSRLARLGLNASLRSIVEESILADGPVAYYPLSEPAGATQANDISGNTAEPLVRTGGGTTVDFGTATGPGTDDLTAATFAAGQYLSAQLPGSVSAWEVFFLRDGAPAAEEALLELDANNDRTLSIDTAGKLSFRSGSVLSPSSVADGRTHHAAVSVSGGTASVYLDGVLLGTTSGGAATGGVRAGGGIYTGGGLLTGVLAHVALYGSALTGTRVAAHANAGLTGFAGDATDARLEHYAAIAGIPSAEIAAEAGSTTMTHVDTTGQQIVEMLRVVEATEGGVLFDDRDGTLTMHNRAHRYTATSAFTLNMAEHEVESDYELVLDRAGILNDVTASNMAGTITARANDQTSIDAYGYAGTSITTASENDGEPLQAASWLVALRAEPKGRVPSLSVDALAQVGKSPSCAAVMDATVGTLITVANQPTQAATSTVDYFIEGWTETYGPESLQMTFNVSAAEPYTGVFIVGDPVRGVVGGPYVLGF